MKALLLSAGRGERLRPLTDQIPKPLIKIGGRPLIHYALAMLRRGGVVDVAINVHHLAERIKRSLEEEPIQGIRITWAEEPELLGTGGPLAGLAEFFGDEPFIVMNSDTIMDLEITRAVEFHRDRRALATFVLRPIIKSHAYSEIQADSSGRVVRMRLLADRTIGKFEEYIGDLDSVASRYMYCGVTICEPAVAHMAVKPPPSNLMGDLFAPALKNGARLFGFVYRGFFRTVDDLAAYERLRHEFDESPPTLRYID